MANLKAELHRRALFTRDASVWSAGVNEWPLSLRVLKLLVLERRGHREATPTDQECDCLQRLAEGDLSAFELVGDAGSAVTPKRAREWLALAENETPRRRSK